jgi:hypothetical protein
MLDPLHERPSRGNPFGCSFDSSLGAPSITGCTCMHATTTQLLENSSKLTV